MIRKDFKYRIYPTRKQTEFLEHQLREACDLYNCALQERKDAWKTCHKNINYYDQANQLKAMREAGLTGIINYSCTQDVLQRVDRAYKAFFAKLRKGQKVGLPRYRSSKRYDSLTFPLYNHGFHLGTKLYLQAAGEIKIKLHRPIDGKIKTLTIKRKNGKWYAHFSAECAESPLPDNGLAVGIDVGVNSLVALSDGTEITNPRYLEASEKTLRRRNRALYRCKKGSKRRKVAASRVAKTHERIANQRADFHHKLSRSLVDEFTLICIEDLNLKGLANGILSKQVKDAGFGLLFDKLSYKAAEAGRTIVKVPAAGTSQECLCGARVAKKLSERTHVCDQCGLVAPRDVVSAKIILKRGLGTSPRTETWPVTACVVRKVA